MLVVSVNDRQESDAAKVDTVRRSIEAMLENLGVTIEPPTTIKVGEQLPYSCQ